MFEDIHKAYYGGRVEVCNPVTLKEKKRVYYYDVNSLYPAASLNDMPGLDCVYFENVKGILELKDLFGYFYCNVKCSNDRYLGLLPKKQIQVLYSLQDPEKVDISQKNWN